MLLLANLFEYDFMRKAFIVGILIAVMVPCIGVVIVCKRLSMIGDALSHTSLAGVAIGLILGFNPVLGAVLSCMIAALGIEVIRKKLPAYSEMSIAIMMSAGIGLTGVLSKYIGNSANFNSFLFGSIVAITDFELYLVIALSITVLVVFSILYHSLFYIALDEQAARLRGIPTNAINTVFTLLTAVTVSVASRTVGALIVSSMMVVPVSCAMQVAKSYRQTVLYAVGFAVLFTVVGLTLSYYTGLKPGGTIVLLGVFSLLLIFLGKKVFARG
ncbi:MAG: metal ABC transporter permease [Eubacteriales bacterium]|nr:metal ABC transporter permease [Eubacteriales bacterium]